jgi:hypothetical protein
MDYEVAPSVGVVNEWRVEAIDRDSEGEIYVAMFSGPKAKQRAEEYAAWKSTEASDQRQERRRAQHDRRAYA